MKDIEQSNPDQLDTGPFQVTTAAAAAGEHLKLGTLVTSAMLKDTGLDTKAVDSSSSTAVRAGPSGNKQSPTATDVNTQLPRPGSSTDLILAAQQRDTNVIRFLLNSGADVTIRDSTGTGPSGRSVKLRADQGTASGMGPDQGLDPVTTEEEQQQQLQHELATSRRDLQDVLQELHGLKIELSEEQAAKFKLQDSFDRKNAGYRTLQDKVKAQQAALSTLQDNMHAQQTAYDALRDKLAVETKAFEQLKGTRTLQDTPTKGNKQWQATQLTQLKELQDQVRAEKRTLRQQQAQCRQQQAELDAGRAQLASDRAKLQADHDAWDAQQAERLTAQACMQEQAAEWEVRFKEQQAECKAQMQKQQAECRAQVQKQEAELEARLQEQEAKFKARVLEHQRELSKFDETHAAIQLNIASTDGCKLQKLAAEQIRLENLSAELAAGHAELDRGRAGLEKALTVVSAVRRFALTKLERTVDELQGAIDARARADVDATEARKCLEAAKQMQQTGKQTLLASLTEAVTMLTVVMCGLMFVACLAFCAQRMFGHTIQRAPEPAVYEKFSTL